MVTAQVVVVFVCLSTIRPKQEVFYKLLIRAGRLLVDAPPEWPEIIGFLYKLVTNR